MSFILQSMIEHPENHEEGTSKRAMDIIHESLAMDKLFKQNKELEKTRDGLLQEILTYQKRIADLEETLRVRDREIGNLEEEVEEAAKTVRSMDSEVRKRGKLYVRVLAMSREQKEALRRIAAENADLRAEIDRLNGKPEDPKPWRRYPPSRNAESQALSSE